MIFLTEPFHLTFARLQYLFTFYVDNLFFILFASFIVFFYKLKKKIFRR